MFAMDESGMRGRGIIR